MLWFQKTLAAVFIAGFAISSALACKLDAAAYDLRQFLKKAEPGQVVFLGRVAAVVNAEPDADLLTDQRIQFTAIRWWRGSSRPSVAARGTVARPMGTDCDGTWDFSVATGEKWLIVGYEENGVIRPSRLLSKRLKGESTAILDLK
jgi:hypothetical protein